MTTKKPKGPTFDGGLCRCCGNMKKCRVLNIEYESFGEKEVYSDMIMDCFSLLLSHLDGVPSERLICATCVNRIRDALSFRRQVLRCEEAFLQMKIYDAKADDSKPGSPWLPKLDVDVVVKAEPVATDPRSDDEHCADALADAPEDDLKPDKMDADPVNPVDPDDPDDLPLTHHITKPELTLPSELIEEKELSPPPVRLRKSPKNRVVKPVVNSNKIPMSKMQQLMRERDSTYTMETNILTIVEYSYVCPFKCRHNHLLCYYCGELHSDPALLRNHTIELHHPKKFKVTEHKKMVKIDLTRIDCRLCAIKIDNLEDFKKHISATHKKKYYFNHKDSVLPFKLTRDELKCAICNVLFPYFHALNKHMNEHFSNYVCETCGLGFVDKGRFMMHQQRHEQGDYPCPDCGKVFKAQYNKELHVDRVHRKKGRVYCPKCDVKLMSYPQKLKHLVEVHGEEPLSFPCTMCERIFDTRRTLTIHRRKDHLKDFRYECQCCGQKFFTRFALNNHMPTHTGERNFKCKVCEKSYPRLKTLKDHMRIHSNDRRYRCHVCGQAFIQNCSLKGHVKSQHPEYHVGI
nr:zinc finger protein 454 [Helicoverpa armigera]